MQNASTVDIFPYKLKTMCYVLVDNNGNVRQVEHHRKCDLPTVAAACQKVRNGEARLYAAWPGNYTTSLFAIDDIELFARVLGVE